jgi:4-hydroxybenzoate polyprenyltransferase
LLRAPNLFTVPGDPLTGALLAAVGLPSPPWGILLGAAGASFLLYVTGLLSNDWFDLEEDRRDRPSRPLPSGRVAPGVVLAAAAGCGLGGVALAVTLSRAAGAVAAGVLAALWIYNSRGKRVPLLGPALLGACRGGSVLLGAAAAAGPRAWDGLAVPAAFGLAAYVLLVSLMAAGETRARPLGALPWLPAAVLLLLGAGVAVLGGEWSRGPHAVVAAAWAAAACASAAWTARGLRGVPPPPLVAAAIGRYLRGLLPLQAALLALAGDAGLWLSLLPMLAWPVAARVGRRFYAS